MGSATDASLNEQAPAVAEVGAWRAINGDVGDERQAYMLPRVFWGQRLEMWGRLLTCVDLMASHPEIWDFLATLVLSSGAKTIVEAGTYRGHATLAMAEALAVSGREGHIWTADVVDFHVQDVLNTTGLADRVTAHVGRFEEMLGQVPDPIDLAFIDASEKENAGLRIEYANMVLHRMRPGGIVVVDDCADDAWPGAKVLRDAASLYLPTGRGLVLLQRK